MESLLPSTEPFEIELLPDLILKVKPITDFELAVIRSEVAQIINDLAKGVTTCEKAGILHVKDYDPENDVHVAAMSRILTVKEIGVKSIIDWNLLNEDKKPLAVTPKAVRAFLSDWSLSETFYAKMTEQNMKRLIAKKNSIIAQNGRPAAG